MLVLTRKLDEQILIGNDIKITLIRVRGNTVRLGIEAPRDVRVVRSELNLHAAATEDNALQIGEREEAFAHPVPPRKPVAEPQSTCGAVETKSQPINRMSSGWTALEQAAPATNATLFVGSVGRDGSHPRLKRAPLSAFLCAGNVEG